MVTRYFAPEIHQEMEPDANGDFVLFEDYLLTLRRIQQLEKDLSKYKVKSYSKNWEEYE
jgi:hypothetical protein